MKHKANLLLVDGQGLCYRAFYAIRDLRNSKGEPTNAIYGFVTMLRKILREIEPDYVAVCFDRKEPTFRHERYEGYKAQRKPMPDELIQQIPFIKSFVSAFGISVFEKPGFEADDLIGTLAIKGEKKGLEVIIVTGDKDMYQLVNDKVKIFNTYKESVIDQGGVEKRFGGLQPGQVVDVLSLSGDSSDNIPGIPGIGEKTAIELIRAYENLDGVYQHLSHIKGPSRQKALRENEKMARMSQDLATIDRDVPIEVNMNALKRKSSTSQALIELLKRFEFRTLLSEIAPDDGVREETGRSYRIVQTEKELKQFLSDLSKVNAFAVDTETTSTDPLTAHLIGLSFSWQAKHAYYIPVKSATQTSAGLDWQIVKAELKAILENERVEKFGQNIKYDMLVLRRHGIQLKGITFDTMVASYLVNPAKFNHNLDDISLEHLGVRKISIESLIGKGKKQISPDQVPVEQMAEYSCEDSDCVFRLVEKLKPLLKENGLLRLFEEVEMPLVSVLSEIEMNGVAIDVRFLQKLSERLEQDLEALTKRIYREAGEEFNINSTKQLSDILFTKLKLPIVKRTKTGYSTNAEVLAKLAQTYDVPKLLLEYREKSKLKSTYIDALPELAHPETNLIHTSFNQTVTSTGRLSSSEPNLQNIPIKTGLGREIRRAFVPRAPKRKILSADYSQVELRILAHLSGDEALTKTFQKNEDVHNWTAGVLYGTEPESVTREMRSVAKTINFSIVYGVSAYGLAQNLGTSVSDAQSFIDAYFKRYPGVLEYLESQKEKAREQGYLTTLLGRRAYFPDIRSSNAARRQFAERAAINAPIQGSAADIIKVAMIRIQSELESKKFESLMILQVHDELVFDTPDDEVDELKKLVCRGMEQAVQLNVPLKVDVTVGSSWYKD